MKVRLFIFLLLLFVSGAIRAACPEGVPGYTALSARCVNKNILFENTTTGTINNATWVWGDGTPNTSVGTKGNVSHNYSTAGTYQVKLIITFPSGCKDSITSAITISNPPSANFTFATNNSCVNNPITFTNTSTGTGNTYVWNFGDGQTSTATSPVHRFKSNGNATANFNVTLTATNSAGCSSNVASQTVSIRQAPVPKAEDANGMDFKSCGGEASHTLSLTDVTFPNSYIQSFNINWGDGQNNSYNSNTFGTVSHNYTTRGSYNIVITATGNNGCSDTTLIPYYKGSNPTAVLDNPGNTTNICAVVSRDFPIGDMTSNSPGTIYTVLVNDGTGEQVYNYNGQPNQKYTHTFSTSSCGFNTPNTNNAFFVRLKASNPCSESFDTVDPITISDRPKVTFNVPDKVCRNTQVTLTGTSQGKDVTRGCSSTLNNNRWEITPATGWTAISNPNVVDFTVRFDVAGNYTIKYSGNNSCGKDSISKVICVTDVPNASFVIPIKSACNSLTVNPSNNSTPNDTCSNTSYLWSVSRSNDNCNSSFPGFSFSSGTNNNSINPSINFSSAGVYQINLRASNFCGTNTTSNQTINIKVKPQVGINTYPPICGGGKILPRATVNNCNGENTTSYNWSFGGGNPNTTNANPDSISYNTLGSYNMRLQVSNECGTTDSTRVISVVPLPGVNAGPDQSVCTNDSISLGAPQTGATYTWTGGTVANPTNPETRALASNTSATPVTINYVLTANNGCVARDTARITIKPQPPAPTSVGTTICSGNTAMIQASGGSSATIQWFTSNTSTNVLATGNSFTTGIHTNFGATSRDSIFYVENSIDGCTRKPRTPVTVRINPAPIVNAGFDRNLCRNPGVAETLTGSPATGTWSGAAPLNGNIITSDGRFTPNTIGNYTIYYESTNAFNCTSKDSLLITVNDKRTVNAGPDLSACKNSPNLNLNATPTGGTWRGAILVGSNQAGTSTPGTYNMIYSIDAGNCLNEDTIRVIIRELPIINIGADVMICVDYGDTIMQNYSPSGGTWSGTGITNGTTGRFSPATSGVGNFTLTYNYTDPATTCSNSANRDVRVNALPIIDAGLNKNLCQNTTVNETFVGNPSGGIWTGAAPLNGNSISPTGVFSPNTNGTYKVYYDFTNTATGCKSRDSLQVNINNKRSVNAGNDISACRNTSNIPLTGAPNGGTWRGTNLVAGNLAGTAIAGTFQLIYSIDAGTCQTEDTLIANIIELPTITMAGLIKLCINNGDTIIQNYTPLGGTWTGTGITDGAAGRFSTSVAGQGTFTLNYTYTDPNTLCTNTVPRNVTVSSLPLVNGGADQVFCNTGIKAQLIGSIGNSGTWQGPHVSPSGEFTPTQVGTFNLIYFIRDANSCSDTDEVRITVNEPVAAIAGPDISLCRNDAPLQLTGSPAGGTWSGSNVSPSGVLSTSIAGAFTLSYAIGTGTCRTQDQLTATIFNLPLVNAGPDALACSNGSIVTPNNFSPTVGNGAWSGAGVINATSGQYDPSLLGPGTHVLTYTFTDNNNCTNSDSKTITINNPPIVNAGVDTSLCNQSIATPFIGTPSGGVWTGTNMSGNNFTPNGTGIFNVSYSFTNTTTGCSNFDNKQISVVDPQFASASSVPDVCINSGDLQLSATPLGGTWTGSLVSSSGIFSPSSAGNFLLQYTFGSGSCRTSSSITVKVNPLPVIQIGPNESNCINNAPFMLINASPAGGTWSGSGISNVNTGLFDPKNVGIGSSLVSYTYTNPVTNCSNSASKNVVINNFTVPYAGLDTTVCLSPIAAQLTGTPSGGVWQGDGINPNGAYLPTGLGSHVLVYLYTNSFACTYSDTVIADVIDPEEIELGNDTAVCINSTPFLNLAQPSNGTWTGTNVSTNGLFNPITSGSFSLRYTKGSGNCQAKKDKVIVVNALPVITPGPNEIVCIDAPDFDLQAYSPVGGVWSGTGITNPTNGTFSANTSGIGSFNVRYSYTNSSTGCSNTASKEIKVVALPQIIMPPTDTLCVQGLSKSYQAFPSGGSWSGAGMSTNGNFTPNGLGDFVVNYTYTDNNACANSASSTITVITTPLVNAGLDTNLCQFPGSIQLFSNPNGGTWTGSNLVSPEGLVDVQNPATLNLNYTISKGSCVVSDSKKVVINALPNGSIGPFTPICANNSPIVLNANATATGTWFGNGISNSQTGIFNPSIAGVGIHPIQYQLIDANTQCRNTINENITVLPIPNASFSASAINCINSNISISNNATGNNFHWDFGDQNTSNQQFPNHSYSSEGNYNIVLIVSNNFACVDSAQQLVEVIKPPVSNFTPNGLLACGNTTLNFSNTSIGTYLNYNWDFGNGNTSNKEIPDAVSFTALPNGNITYYLQLTASNQCGSDSKNDSIVISNSLPQASFGINSDKICDNNALLINNTSSPNGVNYKWHFGDGQTFNGPSPNSYLYQKISRDTTFTLSLVSENGCGKDSVAQQIVIIPSEINGLFSPSTLIGCAPLTVNFNNGSIGASNYNWTFGDGNTSTSLNPSNVYTQAGNYTAQLIAINACTADTVMVNIEVVPLPNISYSTSDISTCGTNELTFSNTTNNTASLTWDFGDGNTSSISPVQHSYTNTGTYQVQLSVTGQGVACSNSIQFPITVLPKPTINIQASTPTACEEATVNFTSITSNTDAITWDFGDFLGSNMPNPRHSYANAGSYTVRAYAYNNNNCLDSTQINILINEKPNANFVLNNDSLCATVANISTQNLSTNATGYNWQLGSFTSTNFEPGLSVLGVGNTTIQLIATNGFACSDTMVKTFKLLTPALAQISFTPSICEESSIDFINNSIDASLFNWKINGTSVSTASEFSQTFSTAGSYNLQFIAKNINGCSDTLNYLKGITVYPNPVAGFYTDDDIVNSQLGFVRLNCTASGFDEAFYEVDNTIVLNSCSGDANLNFTEPGEKIISQRLSTVYGCTATTSQIIRLLPPSAIHVPNAFTPGVQDGNNDTFAPVILGIKSYQFTVIDRWGRIMFDTKDQNTSWNGRIDNVGEDCRPDVYEWKLVATNIFDEQVVRVGTVMLIR